jgi:molybdate transport system substrate-binding protein
MSLHILSGGAAQGLVEGLAAGFRAATGLGVAATFGAVGAMKDRLLSGTRADLVILSRGMITDLVREGWLAEGTEVDLGAVYTGVAVRAGDPAPPLADAAALRDALHRAAAIYFPDPAHATAGIHFAKVLRELGLETEAAARLRTFPNGSAAMEAMAGHQGAAPVGCTQVTEILATRGVALAGLLPRAFELATVYTAAVAARSTCAEAAQRFAGMLASRDTAALRYRLGFSSAG